MHRSIERPCALKTKRTKPISSASSPEKPWLRSSSSQLTPSTWYGFRPSARRDAAQPHAAPMASADTVAAGVVAAAAAPPPPTPFPASATALPTTPVRSSA